MGEQIEGRNPVLEALRSGHEMIKIYLLKGELNSSPLRDILSQATVKKIPIHQVDSGVLDKMAVTRNHQGVIAIAAEWKYSTVNDILNLATQKGEPPFVLLLDGLEDPQNFGSIIRTAEAAGVHGIIIPERRAVGLTSVVSRASAGAIEHVLVTRVTNLTKTIEELKKVGLWFTGVEMEGKIEFQHADLRGAIGVVIGGEGKGISRLVLEHCDQIVKIPMYGQINSLNAAVAAGVILFEIRRQRKTS